MAMRNYPPLATHGQFRAKALHESGRPQEPTRQRSPSCAQPLRSPEPERSPAPSLSGSMSSRRRSPSPHSPVVQSNCSPSPHSPVVVPSASASALSVSAPSAMGSATLPPGCTRMSSVASAQGLQDAAPFPARLQDGAPFSARYLGSGASNGSLRGQHGGSVNMRVPMPMSQSSQKGRQQLERPETQRDARSSARSSMDRREDNNGTNASTCASSACESSATQIASADPASSSSRVLFAKASELIRVEISACERRFAARLEKERSAREVSHAALKSSLESIVCIVETISSSPQATSEPMTMNDTMATRIEDERRFRDEACASLFAKIETLSHQMQYLVPNGSLPGLAMIDEDRINSLLEQERKQRSSAVSSLQQDIERLTEDLNSLPTTLIEGAASWSKINVQLDKERSARDLGFSQIRKEMDAISLSVQGPNNGIDDDYLKVLMEQERRVNDMSRATMWKDFCKELEALSVDVQTIKNSPKFDEGCVRALLENEKHEFQASCVKLQEDVESLAIAMQDVEASKERSRSVSAQCSPMPAMAAPPSTGPSSCRESPLLARLQSTAHLTFQSESTPPLPVLSETTTNVAFQSVFGE